MTLDTIVKLKSNPNYIDYIHQNSFWYKILTRNPEKMNDFIKEVKKNYKLRNTDRILNTLDMIELFENIILSMK